MSEKLGTPFNLLKEVLHINDTQKHYFVQKIAAHLWNLSNKTLGILGLAFKPNTDDMRFAPSIDIIAALQKEGARIQAYDPKAGPKARAILKNVRFVKTPYEAARHADALAVLTEWEEFKHLDFKRVKKIMRHPVLFDGRNLYDPEQMRAWGFQYHAMGRKA